MSFSPRMVEIQGGDCNLCLGGLRRPAAGPTSSWVSALMGQPYCFGKVKTSATTTCTRRLSRPAGPGTRGRSRGATTFVACGEDPCHRMGARRGVRRAGLRARAQVSHNPCFLRVGTAGAANRTASPSRPTLLFLVDAKDAVDLPVFEPEERPAAGAGGAATAANQRRRREGSARADEGTEEGAQEEEEPITSDAFRRRIRERRRRFGVKALFSGF